MKKVKRYEIDSFQKLVNIIDENNFERITTDLLMWLAYQVKFMRQIRLEHPKMTKGKTNWDIAKTSFIWIDDGKHEMKDVTIKNEMTGEVKTFKLDSKVSGEC